MSPELEQIINNLTFQAPYVLWIARIVAWGAALIYIGKQILGVSKGGNQQIGVGARITVIVLAMFIWADMAFFNQINATLLNSVDIDPNTKLLQKYTLESSKGEFAPLYRFIFLGLGIFGIIMFYVAIFKLINITLKKSNDTVFKACIMLLGAVMCYNAESVMLGVGETVGGTVQTFIEDHLHAGDSVRVIKTGR